MTRIAYAAADLGEEEFLELWARLHPMSPKGWTMYTSSNDFALWASRLIHRLPRVGDSKERVFVIQPSDTIDSSAVAPVMRGYGHSYVIDNQILQKDLRRWIEDGTSARDRNLRPGKPGAATYWELSP